MTTTSLVPYLFFNGNCEEALNFYRTALDGTIVSIQRYSDSPMPVEEAHKNKVLHSEFHFFECSFMAADSMPDNEVVNGTSVSLSINMNHLDHAQSIFNKLSDDGQVTMPFQETFWGAQFGMLTDKFGINWMVNCELKKEETGTPLAE